MKRRFLMYLAPLNYDRFFKKIFSDLDIAKRFLEDFLDTKIEMIEMIKNRHAVTDDATYIEFDFRCKIDGAFVIIDMQQWFKADLVQRFYLYHALKAWKRAWKRAWKKEKLLVRLMR
jgi:hypothetical protein